MRLLLTILAVLVLPVSSWAALSCPKEPAGSTLKAETDFNVATGSGFLDNYAAEGMASYMSIASNQNGPASAPNALQAYYPVGHPGGNGTGKISTPGLHGSREFFLCFWMKLDSPFENHNSAGTKIVYITSPAEGHPYYLLMRGGPPYSVWLVSQGGNDLNNQHLGEMCHWPGTCNLQPTGSGRISPGNWHLVQVYLKQSRTINSKDGIARVSVGNDIALEYTNLNTLPADAYAGVHINPVFGGAADQNKTQVDYMWFDAMRISDPAGGGPVEPVEPPSVIVSLITPDREGASVGITGPAAKLRYWDDSTGANKPELPGYVPLSTSYRFVKHWDKETFLCMQPQTPEGEWTKTYQCVGVPVYLPEQPKAQCQDLKDNDGDGKIDFPSDPGCTSALDNDETDAVIPPTSVFSNVVVGPLTLTFTYQAKDCQNVNRSTKGKETKTVTMTCVNDALLNKKKNKK